MNKAIIFFSQEATDHKIQLFSENKKSCAKQNCFGKVLCFWRKNENFDDFHDLFTKSFFDRWRPWKAEVSRFHYFFQFWPSALQRTFQHGFEPKIHHLIHFASMDPNYRKLGGVAQGRLLHNDDNIIIMMIIRLSSWWWYDDDNLHQTMMII